jgi:hypothetical protein
MMDLSRIREAMRQGCVDPYASTRYYKKDSEAPNYQPVADASAQSAALASQLGQEQLAEAKRQYDLNMQVAKPVIDAELATMRQTQAQGADYYNYMVSQQRPIEQALNQSVLNYNGRQDQSEIRDISNRYQAGQRDMELARRNILSFEQNTYNQNNRERALLTGGDTGIYNARQQDIEESVGRALADTRSGQASTTNQMIRQALRYGWSPDRLASIAGSQGLAMASQQAAAANGTRQAGIQNARALMGTAYEMRNASDNAMLAGLVNNRAMQTEGNQYGIQGAMTARNLRQSDSAREWARRLDVAGLYRGLPGASQGAYGLATAAGNSAVQNQMAPSSAMMTQNQNAFGTIMQGQQQQLQGLTGIMNSQTQMAGANAAGQGSMTGSVIGAAGTMAAAFI